MKVITNHKINLVKFSEVANGDLFHFVGSNEICIKLAGFRYASVRDGKSCAPTCSQAATLCEVAKSIEVNF